MLGYLMKRIAQSVLTIFLTVSTVFVLVRLAPGDPAKNYAGPFATNCWLISAEGSADAVVVDPGFEPGRVRSLLRKAGKQPVAVLAWLAVEKEWHGQGLGRLLLAQALRDCHDAGKTLASVSWDSTVVTWDLTRLK